jgi:superfamily I DNA/RNA helicase
MLCYNRLLASHLTTSMDGRDNVRVMTFHGWGLRNGAEFRKDERLLPAMQNGARDRERYDAVLIDEAQDWPCSWFQCAKRALREQETGDLLIVGDGSQSLYRKRDFTWADAGIHASGRVINKRFDLDRNYRNTAEILRAAQPFSVRRDRKPDVVLTLPVNPDTAIRNGPEPLLVKLDDPASECHYAAALIEGWLRGGIEMHGRRQKVKPGDIAILYPRRRPDATIDALEDRLKTFTCVVRPAGDRPTGTLREDGVRILPMHSSRGLQFRIVVLLWADLLPSRFKDSEEAAERRLLYVAMTRAEDMLAVLHSAGSPYIEELYRALGIVPA